MKILFIYLFLSLGGVETVLKNRREGFRLLGIETDYIFLEDHGGSSSFQGLQDSRVFITNNTDRIEEVMAEGGYDLVSVIDTPRVHDILRRRPKRTKVVMEVHTPYPPFRKYIREDIVEDAQAVIVPTAAFGNVVEREMKKPHPPVIVIPNPLNNDFFSGHKMIPKNNRIPITMVSRIESIKDWREGVRVVDKVIQKRSDIDFFLVGRPVEDRAEDIYKEFSKRKIMGHLRWIPFIHYDKMPLFYRFIARNNGICLNSSKGESFGMTLIESMACRVPIVAYDLPVFREVLSNGTYGKIYRSTGEAADHIVTLMGEGKVRAELTERAREAVFAKYTPRAFAEIWRERIG